MRVLRGRADGPEADRAVTRAAVERVAETGEPTVRVWAPHRQVAFGRRDTREDGYDRACAAARERGYAPLERSVGGRAVAYTGASTLAFARIVPVDDVRGGLDERYERLTVDVRRALRRLGVPAERGEPDDAFCPGQHSLRRGGKLVGIAQRVQQGAATASGICVVDERDDLADVLAAVYGALDVPFDPASVGSVAAAGGPEDVATVRTTIEAELVGDREATVERVGDGLRDT
jgi:octanoyl-[GcvH]:protein N-octanoyltransferase